MQNAIFSTYGQFYQFEVQTRIWILSQAVSVAISILLPVRFCMKFGSVGSELTAAEILQLIISEI